MSATVVKALVRRELGESLRSRWFIVYSGVFLVGETREHPVKLGIEIHWNLGEITGAAGFAHFRSEPATANG